MKTTKEERERLRGLSHAAHKSHAMVPADKLLRLLDDADRCAELESRPRRPNKSQAELIADHDRDVARIAELEALLTGACDTLEKYQAANRHNEARAAELEAALRKVDEIRHAMKEWHHAGIAPPSKLMTSLIAALKAPCMEIYK